MGPVSKRTAKFETERKGRESSGLQRPIQDVYVADGYSVIARRMADSMSVYSACL